MTQYSRFTQRLLPILLIAAFIACGTDDEIEYAFPHLQLAFAPSATRQQVFSIDQIVITVEAPGQPPTVREVEVAPEQEQMTLDLIVPVGATSMRVEAFEILENGEKRLIFTGESPIEGLDTPEPQITIILNPATGHLTLEVSKTEVTVGETFMMEINTVEVKNLFAVALEVIFDSERLEPVDITPGSLFAAEDSFLFDDRGLGDATDRLGIAIGRRRGVPVTSNSGTIAVVQFRAKAPGSATVRVATQTESEEIALLQPNGNSVSDFDRLAAFLIRAEVTVNIR